MSEARLEEPSSGTYAGSQAQVVGWDRDAVETLIKESMHPLFKRLNGTLLDRYIEEVSALVSENSVQFKAPAGVRAARLAMILGAIQSCTQSRQRVREWRAGLDLLRIRLADDGMAVDSAALILQFLEGLGSSTSALEADRAALGRFLDIDAIEERVRRMETAENALQEVAIRSVGALLADEIRCVVRQHEEAEDSWIFLIDQSGVGVFLKGYVTLNTPWRLACSALDAMGQMARVLPRKWVEESLDPDIYQTAFRLALDPLAPIWVQSSALRVLRDFHPKESLSVWRRRLLEGASNRGDDIFVRRAILDGVGALGSQVDGESLLNAVLARPDCSPYVRMGAARALRTQPFNASAPLLERILGMLPGYPADPCSQVRAEAVLAVVGKAGPGGPDNEQNRWVLKTCERALASPPESLQTGILLDELPALLGRVTGETGGICSAVHHILQALDQMMAQPSLSMHLLRQAQECREAIIVTRFPEFPVVEKKLIQLSESLVEGDRRTVPMNAFGVSEQVLGRYLAYFARQSLGWFADVRGANVCLQKGDRFRRKMWRVVHELMRPSSAKRPGFHHSVARMPFGHLRAHPLRLGEAWPSDVPGERRTLESEGQWRRYLPLVDDLFSLCEGLAAPVRVQLFSAQGVTTVSGPPGLFDKLKLLTKLTFRYASFSRLRDQPFSGENQEPLRHYLDVLKKMGVYVSFKPNGYTFEGAYHPLRDAVLERLMSGGLSQEVGVLGGNEEGVGHG